MKIHNKKLLFIIPAVFGFTISEAQTDGKKEPGVNVAFMDKTIRPNDDFFKFVNGTWLNKTEIPSDKTRWGSFDELRLNTDKDVLAILAEATKNPNYKSNTDQGKAINYYKSIMDTASRDKNGVVPLKPYLAKIDAVKNIADLQSLISEMAPVGGIGFFGTRVGPDDKNSNRNVVNLSPGSLGLPDRDYYVSDDADSKEKREKYVQHITKMLQYIGQKPETAKSNAEKVLALEIKFAQPRLDRVERRDDRKTYNPMSIADLQKQMSSINWNSYFTKVGLAGIDSIIVSQPRYMLALDQIFKEKDVESWKAYMKWTLLKNNASQLSTGIETANWEFYGKTLTGAIQQRPLNERALETINGSVGEALGKLYVEKKFPAEAKEKAQKMIQYVMRAYENRINNLSWMGSETKVKAIEKLNKLTIKIGYPDKWKDYSALTLKSPAEGGTYFDNAKAVSKWRYTENIAELKKPVDKTKWGMSPQTVNAYFNPSYNEIVFPAAILQPPFYNYQADEAVNFGGIGGVIGHEISHGFDDSGARYNADGNLVDWWTAEDLKQFSTLTEALADQYSVLEPLKGVFVDGKFTLGENIGDLGGVNAAYDGLQLYLKENGNPGLIDGFTPEQRFFISWATIWRAKMRDEDIKNRVKTDPHSPAMYRSYVPLQNIDAFYDAFKINKGDGMYISPEKRVKIW